MTKMKKLFLFFLLDFDRNFIIFPSKITSIMATLVDHCATTEDSHTIDLIYTYWFGGTTDTWSKTYPLNIKLWLKVQKNVDQEIKDKFEKYLIDAATVNSSLYQRWQTTHQGKIALIILFDQFSRNIYFNTAKIFEFDPLALHLALGIIDDPSYMTSYSLAEQIFIYFPLVHSENLIHTTKGAELLRKLVSQVSQRDLQRRYHTIARLAKNHQKIIELFGRYPDRNDLLGRQSTPEEVEYLKTACNGFSTPDSASQISSSKQLPYPLLKILVLHSFHQNANTLKYGAKKIFKQWKDVATFYFANGPLPYNPTGEIKELPVLFGNENLLEISSQRQWWYNSKDSKTYHYLDVSLHYIDQLFKSAGPFDGILGFAVCDKLTEFCFIDDTVLSFRKEHCWAVS